MSKRIWALVLLLGCLGISSFAATTTFTVTPTLGSQEFFGANKIIKNLAGFEVTIAIPLVQWDEVYFKLPAGFLWKNAAYWVADNVAGNFSTNRRPVINDGLVDFQYLSGIGANVLKFNVTAEGGYPAGSVLRLLTVAAPPANVLLPVGAGLAADGKTDDVWIQVPMNTPGPWDSPGNEIKVTYDATKAWPNDVSFDTASTPFLVVYQEYQVIDPLNYFMIPLFGGVDSSVRTIDVFQLRKEFEYQLGIPNTRSQQNWRIERNPELTTLPGVAVPYDLTKTDPDPLVAADGGYFDPTTFYKLKNTDIFEMKIFKNGGAANFEGIDSVNVRYPAATTGGSFLLGPPCVLPITGDIVRDEGIGNLDAVINNNNYARINVDGVTVLDDRTIDFAFEFKPDVAQKFVGKQYALWINAWIWKNNGTLFRSQFAVAAVDSGYNTALRVGNYGPVPAHVYADIWMDDGQKVFNVLLTDGTGIPADGFASWTFAMICAKAAAQNPGFTYVTTWPSQSTKGRFRLLVQGTHNDIGAYQQYVTPFGITSVIMEKVIDDDYIW